MTAADVTDALGDLLNALMLLVNGSPTAECEWNQEPGAWRWTFLRPSHQDVEVRIEFKAGVFVDPWPSEEQGEVRALELLRLSEVIKAVAAGARRCLDEFGAEGFARQWSEHPFPRLQLEALEHWLLDGVAAPLYWSS